ncbi:MAG: DUF4230 domain-containing protein [Clostridia bacterium]|nr:DUF4230 domain-containing protein [Clostridia bacterium]
MKKNRLILFITTVLMSSFIFTGCSLEEIEEYCHYIFNDGEIVRETEPEDASEETTEPTPEPTPIVYLPEKTDIDSICQLATLDCYYNCVAKSVKFGGSGLAHMGEKDRKFWIEYTATARVGIDVAKVKMTIDEEKKEIHITLPSAQIIGEVNADPNSYDINQLITEPDNWLNENPIDASDVTESINQSLNELRAEISNDTALMERARNRAKDLIKNYIGELADLSGEPYKIVWEDASEIEQ